MLLFKALGSVIDNQPQRIPSLSYGLLNMNAIWLAKVRPTAEDADPDAFGDASVNTDMRLVEGSTEATAVDRPDSVAPS